MKDFAAEDSVVFGDVLLQQDRVTVGPNGGQLNPGKGGWPTIRYFNKGTGYDGAEYQKKTGDSMCTVSQPHLCSCRATPALLLLRTNQQGCRARGRAIRGRGGGAGSGRRTSHSPNNATPSATVVVDAPIRPASGAVTMHPCRSWGRTSRT